MNFGTYARIEATSGVYVVTKSSFLDSYDGADTVVVDPDQPCTCFCDVDMSDGTQRFLAFCRANGYSESELRLTFYPAEMYQAPEAP
jgi:hypothetical protein